jgi:cyclic pyranopterin phosphate synthase
MNHGDDTMDTKPGGLTHLNERGEARMVDVGAKATTAREAVAEGELHAREDVLDALFGGTLAKGDALGVARVAAIMAAKQTAGLIPLCHPIATTAVEVDISRAPGRAVVRATVRVSEKTGAEMEAMTAVSVGLLTLYDMAKAMQKDMTIERVRLRRKTGGKSGDVAFP